MSRLSKPDIIQAKGDGRIFIHPFNEKNLKGAQYDVRLGPWHYREHKYPGSTGFFNPFSEEDVDRTWGKEPEFAILHIKWAGTHNNGQLLKVGAKSDQKNLAPDELIIWIDSGETILGHTIEFIGGCDNAITTQMRARSSFGRSGIEVCKCAGLGDIGFFNRWTMEITNNGGKKIPLVVGCRIAQITFDRTTPVDPKDVYAEIGKYQPGTTDPESLIASWNAETMIKPKLFKDFEITEGLGFRRFISKYI